MKRLLFSLVPLLSVLLLLSGSGIASAHGLAPERPNWTCISYGCDGNFPAGQTCGTASRQTTVSMVANNGTTVGYLYLYYVDGPSCGDGAMWGTFHLSSSIRTATVWSTRHNSNGTTNYSQTYSSPSTGVYHDAEMIGCNSPDDVGNAAVDWTDAQGHNIHNETGRYSCP